MRWLIYILAGIVLCGCAAGQKQDSSPFYRYSQGRKLASAVNRLGEGNASAAAAILTRICNEKGVAGVTDEALFRLSLLQLNPHNDRDAHTALRTLERLHREYPDSPWAVQSSSLEELLGRTRGLKEQNRELRQNIQKLKRLDLELEQKNRR